MKRLAPPFLSVLLLFATPAQAAPTPMPLVVDRGTSISLAGAASSVFVANPDIADVQVLSPTHVMLFGKRTGETSFMATDNRGNILAEHTLVVSQDLSGLREELKIAIPGNDIKAKPVPNGIILTGTARDAASVADAYKIAMRYMPQGGDIINRIQVTGSNQIQIRVRFAEVKRNIDNSFGINWQNLFAAGNFAVGFATGNVVHAAGSGVFNSGSANKTGLFPRPNNATLSSPNNVVGASTRFGNFSVEGMIDALAQEGFLTVLAEPNLTAMSGETANFLAGGEFPIPIPQGNGTISINFKSYGISLAFTPTLLSGERISLHVRPEVSELTNAGSIVLDNITVPALRTRKAETTVEVASGESFAIAGLMDNNQSQVVNKFPMLGDLPILGSLFRSDQFINGQTELVVIITPYVVKPSKRALSLPTDGYSPPTESERYIGLRTNTADPDARTMSGEPIAEMDAPDAYPVSAVSKVPSNKKQPPLIVDEMEIPVEHGPTITAQEQSVAVSAKQKTKAAAKPVKEPLSETQPAALPESPLVLYAAEDKDKRIGGLIVE